MRPIIYFPSFLPLNSPDEFVTADCGDYVVAIGCHDLLVTGKKREQKKYYKHTTRPGSLKEMTMDQMFARWGGGEVLRRAVSGMLPKNKLRDKRLARLKGTSPDIQSSITSVVAHIYTTVFEGLAHPYKANTIRIFEPPRIGEMPEVKAAFAEAQAQ